MSKTCLAASAVMAWSLADGCVDGLGVQARYFDDVNGLVWPGTSTDTFQTAVDGQGLQDMISCIPGSSICYGAEPNPTRNTIYWGVGLADNHPCTDCCFTCGVTNPQINLVCN